MEEENKTVEKTQPDIKAMLDEKLAPITSGFNKVNEDLQKINTEVGELKNSKEPEPEYEYEDEEEKKKYQEIERKVAKKTEEKINERLEKEKEVATKKNLEAQWFKKTIEDFPEAKDEKSELWQKAEKIYNQKTKTAQMAEDVVYDCCLRAQREIEREKMNEKKDETNKNVGTSAGGSDESDSETLETGLTAEQMRICKQHKIDPKKYKERLKSRSKMQK